LLLVTNARKMSKTPVRVLNVRIFLYDRKSGSLTAREMSEFSPGHQ